MDKDLKGLRISLNDELSAEVLEMIFQYLDLEDLMRCCEVCWRWREIINQDRFWSPICRKRSILNELRVSMSLQDGVYQFKNLEYDDPELCRLSPPCQWRKQFSKYQHLMKNWKEGAFTSATKEHSRLDPEFPGVIMSRSQIQEISNFTSLYHGMFTRSIPAHVEELQIKGDFLFYVLDSKVVCEKWDGWRFVVIYSFIIPEGPTVEAELNPPRFCSPLKRVLIFGDEFLAIRPPHSQTLFFYILETGQFVRNVNFNLLIEPTTQGGKKIVFEAYGNVIIVHYLLMAEQLVTAWRMHIKYITPLVIFSYKENRVVRGGMKTTFFDTIKSKKFLGLWSYVPHGQYGSELVVLSVESYKEVDHVSDIRCGTATISNNKIIYVLEGKVGVKDLTDKSSFTFDVTNNQPDISLTMAVNRFGFLVTCVGETTLDVWDLKRGEKLYTLFESTTPHMVISGLTVDDRFIAFNYHQSHSSSGPGVDEPDICSKIFAFW